MFDKEKTHDDSIRYGTVKQFYSFTTARFAGCPMKVSRKFDSKNRGTLMQLLLCWLRFMKVSRKFDSKNKIIRMFNF